MDNSQFLRLCKDSVYILWIENFLAPTQKRDSNNNKNNKKRQQAQAWPAPKKP